MFCPLVDSSGYSAIDMMKTLTKLRYTIIDEADEMLGNDWSEELHTIMSGAGVNEDVGHNFLMFSATFPKSAQDLAGEYLATQHYVVKMGRAGSTHKNIQQDIIWVDFDKKLQAMFDLLNNIRKHRVIIFCNARVGVDKLDDYLYNKGLPTTTIHSGLYQREREQNL